MYNGNSLILLVMLSAPKLEPYYINHKAIFNVSEIDI